MGLEEHGLAPGSYFSLSLWLRFPINFCELRLAGCGSRGRERERVRVGTGEAESVWRGRERSACRVPLTNTRVAHAGRSPLVAHATATAHAGRVCAGPESLSPLRADLCFKRSQDNGKPSSGGRGEKKVLVLES